MNRGGLVNLRPRMREVGYSTKELAEILNVKRQTVNSWELLLGYPSAAMLPLIADTLLCSIDHLYGREGDTKCQ